MSRFRLVLNAAFAAVLLYWGANALYTGTKALSLPFNGPVEQYLSMEGQDRIAAAVDLDRLEKDLLRPAAALSSLDLIHICHEEICRQISPSDEDATGIDNLVRTKTGLCFDYCGATYALALHAMRNHTQLADKVEEVRWVRGFASTADTLASAHSWLEAVDKDRRWYGYDAAIDPQQEPGGVFLCPVTDFLLNGRYFSLNRKQADIGGNVRTSITWSSILLARKNLIEELVSRLSLPRGMVMPGKAVVLLALFVGALAALSRRARSAQPKDEGARDAPDPQADE